MEALKKLLKEEFQNIISNRLNNSPKFGQAVIFVTKINATKKVQQEEGLEELIENVCTKGWILV